MGGNRQFSPAQVAYIYKRDEGKCVYCGRPASEVDHVVSWKDGGKSITANAVCTCHSCNMKKVQKKYKQDFMTRGIFWLLEKGEDMRWTDELYKD